MTIQLHPQLDVFRPDIICKEIGIQLVRADTIRSPMLQAKLWRQGRKTSRIKNKIDRLNHLGAFYIAHCIESVGPQKGPRVTNAIPGRSPHQYGMAADWLWIVDNKVVSSPQKLVDIGYLINGYSVLVAFAKLAGLTAGTMSWDMGHVECNGFREIQSMELVSIDNYLQEIWADDCP